MRRHQFDPLGLASGLAVFDECRFNDGGAVVDVAGAGRLRLQVASPGAHHIAGSAMVAPPGRGGTPMAQRQN